MHFEFSMSISDMENIKGILSRNENLLLKEKKYVSNTSKKLTSHSKYFYNVKKREDKHDHCNTSKNILTWSINTKYSKGLCILSNRIKMYKKHLLTMWICDIALNTVVIWYENLLKLNLKLFDRTSEFYTPLLSTQRSAIKRWINQNIRIFHHLDDIIFGIILVTW